MNSYNKRFWKQLTKWIVWGAACASLSFMCAWVFGDAGGGAWVAMVAGVLSWSGLCTAITATEAYERRMAEGGGAWARAFRAALIVRVGGTALGALVLTMGAVLPGMSGLSLLIWPDFWAGVVSIRLSGWVFGGFVWQSDGMPRGLGEVYVTTLMQGAWVVGSLVALTAVCYGVRRVVARRQRRMPAGAVE